MKGGDDMVVTGGLLFVAGLYFWASGSRAKINILGKYQGNAGAVLTFIGAMLLGVGATVGIS